MTAPKAAKPATASTVNGLHDVDQLVPQIDSEANSNSESAQISNVASAPSFALNSHERVCVEIGEYNGRKIVDVRRWFCAKDGTMQRSRKGVAMSLRHLPALVDLLNTALAEAKAGGLLENADAGGGK
jgi:hypothetical protein